MMRSEVKKKNSKIQDVFFVQLYNRKNYLTIVLEKQYSGLDVIFGLLIGSNPVGIISGENHAIPGGSDNWVVRLV
jgi:hypothetical protein